jgi:DNA-binding response OmpR family regulator
MSDLLLVDNDRRIVDLVAFFLRKTGHVVRTADSFEGARTALAERAPDLMLADLDLGAERGDEELPRLAHEGLLPPTLIVSGYLDGQTEQHLRRIPGVVGALRKPFDLSALEEGIGAALVRARDASATADDADQGWIDVVPWQRNRRG